MKKRLATRKEIKAIIDGIETTANSKLDVNINVLNILSAFIRLEKDIDKRFKFKIQTSENSKWSTSWLIYAGHQIVEFKVEQIEGYNKYYRVVTL